MNSKIFEPNLPIKSDFKIRNVLSNFVKKDSAYKNKFLQSRYKTAFDGYSYIGQKDSLNQYDTDMLHSFVLSEFQNIEDFPKEFHSFLTEEWNELKATVRKVELEMIQELNIPELIQFYENDIMGYMMSCNYYPKPKHFESTAENNTRLSAHKDASLFTTFPYGVSKGLSFYNTAKNHIEIDTTEKAVMFPGYFLELISNITALNHQVDLPNDLDSERYSFAVFSIPKPNSTFWFENQKITGNDYYTKYLSLF